MRVKLDENLGRRGALQLRGAGWDVATVVDEQLCAASDQRLIEACQAERRVLITLDKGFSSVLRFPPERYAGIVVLRLPEPLTPATIDAALQRLLAAAAERVLDGRLWIIDERRVREFTG